MGQGWTQQEAPAAPTGAAPKGRTPDEIEALLNFEEPRLARLRLAADEAARSATTTLSLARFGYHTPPSPSFIAWY